MMRAQSPAGMRPPWRSRPSWFFRVQMTASTRWRSQFGNGRGCFSSLRAGRIRGQSQAVAGEELLGALSGQALVRDDGGAGRGAVRGLAFQGLPGLVPLAVQLRVREAEPGDGPVAGAGDQQPGAPVPARMARADP
jgi:hypothetical protein